MVRLLVTGALGVNGAPVMRKFLKHGLEPVAYDVRPDFSLLRDLEGKFELVRGDINDPATLTRTLLERRIQRLVHLAALMPPDAQADPLTGFRVNALGTVQVLEAARIAGVERVLFTSSRAAYGEITGEYGHPTYRPVGEDHPLNPVIVYDVTKAASEGMGRNYQRNYGLEFVALRFATIYGPGKLARHGPVSLHSRIIETALAGQPVRIPRGGDQRDDVMYVEDVADAIVLATLKEQPKYWVYNIGSGAARSLAEFAVAVRRWIPRADIEIGPGLDYFGMGVNYYCRFDITRAREDLGYVPRYSFEAGVGHYLEMMERLGLKPGVAS
jgi:UDP-glucose 4-epimerase